MTTWDPVAITVAAPPALPAWDTTPPAEDWEAPPFDDTGTPTRVQVAISTIRDFRWLGELLDAAVDDGRSQTIDGTGTVRIQVPTSDPSALVTLLDDVELWGDRYTGRPKLIDRAAHIVINGKVDASYVLRSDITIDNGVVSLSGVEPTRLFDDRIVGTGRRLDLLYGRGHFPGSGTYGSLGINWTGDPGDIEFFTPGVRGGRCIRIRGDSLTDRLEIGCVVSSSEGANQKVTVRSSAFLQLPDGAADDTTVMAVEVRTLNGGQLWPPSGSANPYVANIEEDMPREEWMRSPTVAAGQLPAPPFGVWVVAKFYPAPLESGASSGAWTYIDEIEIFQRDTLATRVERDLVDHQLILLRDAQEGRDKSSWSLGFARGTDSGVSEIGVWRHEDEQPLRDALSAISSRDDGPDPPWVGPDWKIHIGARRGSVRDDIVLGPSDIVAVQNWSHDPGAMASSMRGVTDRGEAYWRVESVVTDTSQTAGHVIERQARAPNDMELLALDQWTAAQLAQVAQPQDTARLVVRWDLGRRIAVGDSFRVIHMDGLWRLDRTMRVVKRTLMDAARLVVLDVGTDEAA
ncbi:hypothetical protein PO878_03895 [Iamia majanohamensis]|uniref:Uncharacterized protein n=1 Tax=Iamia majanohamensis TaxID=467976 RepID=A0AAE9Y6K4_9ACTN|nr:hypothetical protein [Iamia majanohamensis]WCO67865.1 hypothetical protein PO878_03895 [Iamia majanohamensis]